MRALLLLLLTAGWLWASPVFQWTMPSPQPPVMGYLPNAGFFEWRPMSAPAAIGDGAPQFLVMLEDPYEPPPPEPIVLPGSNPPGSGVPPPPMPPSVQRLPPKIEMDPPGDQSVPEEWYQIPEPSSVAMMVMAILVIAGGKIGVPSGIRTRVIAVKGRCPRPG